MLNPKGHDKEKSSLLRKRAEEMDRENKSKIPEDTKKLSSEEMQQVLHELQVHQIELQMQNEELRRSQEELNLARARYFDLYDEVPVGYCTVSDKGIILEANLTVANLLGVPKGMLVKQLFSRFIVREDQDTYYLHHKQLFEIGKPRLFDLRMVKENGTLFWAHLVAKVEKKDDAASVCRIVLSDITEHKEYEDERELTSRLIVLINAPGDFHKLMSELTKSLQGWSGCEAVGIRLSEGDDFPYYETRGFPPVFVQEEKHLCTYGADGAVLRDNVGRPILDCMCGNVLSGRLDSSKPFFTAHGSFWTNSTTSLLASTTEADRQSRTRNRCNGEGYESVALIPLRARNQVFGLLQFNDHRTNRFTCDLISHLERIADSLAVALSRRQAEERLRESEKLFRTLTDNIPDIVARFDLHLRHLYVNRAIEDITGKPVDTFIGKTNRELGMPSELAGIWEQASQRAMETGETVQIEFKFPASAGIRFYESRLIPERTQYGQVVSLLVLARDITERKLAEEELKEKMDELQRFHNLTVGRELTMIELKKEVNALLKKSGQEEKYRIVG